MFSNWFSGDDLEHYRTSPHKQRIDAVASSLLRLKYASEVIRQHLHEWLRFSLIGTTSTVASEFGIGPSLDPVGEPRGVGGL